MYTLVSANRQPLFDDDFAGGLGVEMHLHTCAAPAKTASGA